MARRTRTFSGSRVLHGILLVTILHSMMFDSVRQRVIDTLTPATQEVKSASQPQVPRDSNGIAVNSIRPARNTTESPSSLIRGALKIVVGTPGNDVQVSKGGDIVKVSGTGTINMGIRTTRGKLRQVLTHVIPRTRDIRRDDITLLTHLSTSYLSKLKLQAEWWNGPISAAIVVTNEKEVNTLLDFVKANQDILGMTSFHVLVEANSDPNSYPYNVLRNMAMREAESDYILALDVDFVTEGYPRLVKLVRENNEVREALHSNRLLVLPAFENTEAGAGAVAIPQSKADVVKMVEGGLVAPFEINKWPPGHKPTNFSKYYQNETDVLYDIEYESDFEPYFLAYRHGLPRYWNDFRSYFFNKFSYFLEAHLMGYKFSVLRDFFVFHMGESGRPPARSGGVPPPSELEKLRKFHEYLWLSYGLPLSGNAAQLVADGEVLK
ncbi:hypothetical protein MHU86_15191 [Fragilaria crotonensis]|nr:hypothetical protein MHU86_15191 [Fragilaria crotonensis]